MELDIQRSGMELKMYELTCKIVSECGYELYDVEYITGSSTLRVYIMSGETKTAVIEDCVAVDRAFTPYCEEEQWIPDDFHLEVSSPGVYRNIKTLDHFKASLDEIIAFSIFGKLDAEAAKDLPGKLKGSNKFRGKLVEVDEDKFKIDIDGAELTLDYEKVKKVTLDPDLQNH